MDTNDTLYKDFKRVNQIAIIPLMLEIICRTTGMGFAAVARVTEDRWLACSVRDEINFGLKPGGELKLETTICNEIRQNKQEVVIDHVAQNKNFCNHHTPAMYGFQSYISYPIFLKNGDFFGTLCAIDPKPAQLENTTIKGTFLMFAELLSLHIQNLLLLEKSQEALEQAGKELLHSYQENNQYRQVANHNLKEPLRKIAMFSNMLLEHKANNSEEVQRIALKINSFANELGSMLQHISDFSELEHYEELVDEVDLNKVIQQTYSNVKLKAADKKIVIDCKELPVILGISKQMNQLFYYLIEHITTFSKNGSSPLIKIYSSDKQDSISWANREKDVTYCEIFIEVNTIEIEKYELKNMFSLFLHLNDRTGESFGVGLAYCQKIIRNHKGVITARQLSDDNMVLSIVLPLEVSKENVSELS